MPPKNPSARLSARITAALAAHVAADDPLAQLGAARSVREGADDLEAAAIRAARKAGATWSAIGAVYGLTKQGAQQRFRPMIEDAAPGHTQRATPQVDASRKARQRSSGSDT